MQKMRKQIRAIGDIMTQPRIDALTKRYQMDRSVIANLSLDMFNSMYPQGRYIFQAINEQFYHHGDNQAPRTSMSGAEVERSVITLLAASGEGPFLAVHFYWGLVSGLCPEDMAEILLLVGSYNGIDKYTGGLRVLAETLEYLQHPHDLPDPEETDPVLLIQGLLRDIEAHIVA